MSCKFADYLLLRMPVKSWEHYRDTSIEKLLADPFFLAAVYIASPGFYARLARVNFNYAQLNSRECNTLKKYHNRICFRPVPFGLFSSVSLIKWGNGHGIFTNSNANVYTPCIKPDQAYVMAAGDDLLKNELKDEGLFFPNSTLYRAGKEYRFVFTSLDEKYKTRDYNLQSAEYSALLKQLLRFCAPAKSKPAILHFIEEQSACLPGDAEAYFRFMVDSQLLTSSLQPNITGADYLQRLLEKAGTITSVKNARVEELRQILTPFALKQPVTPDAFISLDQQLRDSLPGHQVVEQGGLLSLILLNQTVNGALDTAYQNKLSEALFALDKLVPHEQPKALTDFVKTFKKQFDQQSIPLLKALDPEIGIGYQVRDADDKNPLLETVHIQKKAAEHSLKWSQTHRYLLNCWHKEGNSEVIRLEKDELLQLGTATPASMLGISVLFRLIGGKVIIDNAGGNNAAALMGRFTVADAVIADAAVQIAAEQEAANPDIIFAEVLHLSDPHIDNVNLRERVWKYELPLTSVSLNAFDQQIQLADLYVSVENDKVILRSVKHNKIVIPRLTSAYNHTLNKLPLFCFLADLPYQYGKCNYTLDMAQFFPGLSFYPRVEYLDSILYLATWVLKKSEIIELDQEDDLHILARFYEVAARVNLPDAFSLVQGDQQLVFYRNQPGDVLLFAESVKNKNEVIIKEYLQDETGTGTVKDAQGNGYISQFNAFVYPDMALNLTPAKPKAAADSTPRQFVLGSEWLYLKIYVPRIAISGLLLKIAPLLAHTYSCGPIEKWFFIRYEDHAPHIRLRIKMAADNLGEVLAAFKQKLENSIYQHVVREYQADTYSRELERYQAADYELTEDLFWRSSQLVMHMLRAEKHRPDGIPAYLFALYTTREILNVFLPEQTEQISFTHNNYQQFMLEFDDKKITFELDKKYRELSKNINAGLRDNGFYSNLNMKISAREFIKAAQKLAAGAKHQQYKSFLASIIHMHLNRIFVDEPRKQEMIVYYFLYKFLVSDMARKK